MTNKTQAQRRALATDHFAKLAPDGDGEAMIAAFTETHGAFGDLATDYFGADIWARPGLRERDRNLASIAILGALDLSEFLPAFFRAGLRRGLTRPEMEEALIQVGGYAGMPFGNKALTVAAKFFADIPDAPARQPAAHLDDNQRHANAVAVMATLTKGRANPDPEAARAAIVEALGGVGELAFDFAFGELWSRDQLSRRDRSLVVVSILAALGKDQELAFHVPGALNHGVTREEVEEIMVTLCGYGGFPRAVEGMRAARAAFLRIDEQAENA
jgi:4-carboxymuconolactone decarboxylase